MSKVSPRYLVLMTEHSRCQPGNPTDQGEFQRMMCLSCALTQIAKSEQLLPIVSEEEESTGGEVDYIYEPSQDFIFNDLIPKSLKIQFYKAILESNASEHGARMTAMDKATENADELLKDLKLTYNRTRQAAITKEILEIVGGAEALAQG